MSIALLETLSVHKDPIIADVARNASLFIEQYQAGELSRDELYRVIRDLFNTHRVSFMLLRQEQAAEITKAFQQMYQVIKTVI